MFISLFQKQDSKNQLHCLSSNHDDISYYFIRVIYVFSCTSIFWKIISLLWGRGLISSKFFLLCGLTFIFGGFRGCMGSMCVCTSTPGNVHLCPSMTCSFLLSNCLPLSSLSGWIHALVSLFLVGWIIGLLKLLLHPLFLLYPIRFQSAWMLELTVGCLPCTPIPCNLDILQSITVWDSIQVDIFAVDTSNQLGTTLWLR